MTIVWTWQIRLNIQHFMTNPKTWQYQVFGAYEAVPVWLARDCYEACVERAARMARPLRHLPLLRPLRRDRIREVVATPDRTVHSMMVRNVDFHSRMTT
jgi:hypothetical protein